ncbi:alpha/beta fold hydrolase [Phragmitibacter flavus]|nr:alpha/beta fold hydrolase [Phragmitibacter flavus]
MEDKTWSSFDGKQMPWTLAAGVPDSEEKMKAVVITIHGLSGAASDFWMLDEEWPKLGVAVYGLQLRGQGNDPEVKKRGHVASSRLWQRDLLAFHRLVRKRHPGKPVVWYAESLGTLIALHTVTDLMEDEDRERDRELPAGIIMSAPAAGLRMQASQLRLRIIHTLVQMFPWVRVSLTQMAGLDEKQIQVTADSTHGGQMAVTPHHVSKFSLRLLGEVDEMMKSSRKAARELRMPVLVLASPHDVIADEGQVQEFFESIGSKDKEIRWYRESYHLLLHDREREQVMKDATDWLNRQVR